MGTKIAVIGAGIIGISTALRILQAVPDADVTIYTENTTPNTTSDVAAGFWAPSFLDKTPEDLVIAWSKETYDHLALLARSDPESTKYGVFLCPGFKLFNVADPGPRYWSHIPIGFRMASSDELGMFPSRIKSGFYFVTAVAEGSKLLPYLTSQFKSLGGKLVENYKVGSFSQIYQLGYKQIVNCTGIGALQLCNDKLVYPIRGQVHRVSAPWLKFWFLCDDGAYCLLNSDAAVLGGVAQPNNWDTSVSEQDKASILARNYSLWPALSAAPVLADVVGLRPAREAGVRLEKEVVDKDGEQYTIYHNYGHGGSGLTLFWGCAGSLAKLIQEDLNPTTLPKPPPTTAGTAAGTDEAQAASYCRVI